MIEEFEAKILAFFHYIGAHKDGERLIVKINCNVSEDEIQEGFARLYRTDKTLHRRNVGERFYKEIDDLVHKLCADFEAMVRRGRCERLALRFQRF